MAIKAALIVCVLAFVQTISTQCIGGPYDALGWEASPWAARWAAPYAAGPLAAPLAGLEYPGYAPCALAASNGGGFTVSSISPIAPTGVFVTSENVYDGAVLVTGQLPFLSTISLEGLLPTAGAGAISYGCGNGNVAILSEDIAPANFGAGPYGYGPAGPAIGYGAGPLGYGGPTGFGAGGCGCGCGALF